MRAAVEDIADDMEHVDAALADQAADGDDEFFRHARAGDGVDDLTVILLFGVLRVRVEQLVDDIGEGFGIFLRTLERVYLEATVLHTCTRR